MSGAVIIDEDGVDYEVLKAFLEQRSATNYPQASFVLVEAGISRMTSHFSQLTCLPRKSGSTKMLWSAFAFALASDWRVSPSGLMLFVCGGRPDMTDRFRALFTAWELGGKPAVEAMLR